MMTRFAHYYRPHIKLFIADLFAAFLLSVCNMVYPIITRLMLNSYIPKNRLTPLLISAVVLLLIYCIKLGLNYFVTYYGHVMGVSMQAEMRHDIFAHLQKLPLSYFDNNKTGTIMSRIVNDLQDVSELAHHGPEDLFLSLVMLLGSFAIMASICLPLTAVIYLTIPLMVLSAVSQRKAMAAAFSASRKAVGEINATLENSIAGIRVSKAYTNRNREEAIFGADNERFVKARSAAYRVMARFHSGMSFSIDILHIALYVAGGWFVYTSKIDLADFTAFVLYINLFTSPIERLVNFTEQYQEGMSGFRRFLEIIDAEPETDVEGAIEIRSAKGEITFDHVTFSYTEGQTVLHELSFTAEPGKTLALVGQSGGGKTTICHLIPRFYHPSSGRILLDGHDVSEITADSLRRQIGIVSQDVFLFDATIYDNIACGCPDAREEDVLRAAKLADIDEFVSALPNGYQTEVGERGVKLSGGQKQRIAIARVFLKDPPILILDEATSALDNTTELTIQKSLEQLSIGRTTIVVAHRLTTVKNADRILVISDKGIAEDGDHLSLIRKNGIYASLWNQSIGTMMLADS